MTYQVNNIIQASDFNTFATGTASGQPFNGTPNINSVLGVGYGILGYGQTALSSVAVNDTISASNWAAMTSAMSRAALHQNSSLGKFTTATSDELIKYQANLATNINTVYNNRLNARSQGTATTYQSINAANPWSNTLTNTFTASFETGDKARYFFNSGGQIKFTVAHTSGGGALNNMFYELAIDIGTLTFSAPNSGTFRLGTNTYINYTGLTQTGYEDESYINVNWRPVYDKNYGYYALNTTNQTIFKQIATAESITYATYGDSYISLGVSSNGSQGSNGDTGNIITFKIVYGLVPSGLQVTGTSTVNCTVVEPETTYLANSWGTVGITSNITRT